MAHDHCFVNFCINVKRNTSGENLSFFNFPPNDLLRLKWIAATRGDEGPDFKVRVVSWPVSIRVIICSFKRTCQVKKGSTLVCSAHFQPEDMYKTKTGLTRLIYRSLHGQNKVQEWKKFADQQAEENRRQFFVHSIRFNSHEKLLAEYSIERKSRSLLSRVSNSSLVTTRLLLTAKSSPSSWLVAAIHFDLNKSFEGKLKKKKFLPLLSLLSLRQKLT